MNGSEQKKHTTVTTAIANSVDAIAAATVARFTHVERRISDAEKFLRLQIGDERTHRLKLADEQRAYVDSKDAEVRRLADRALSVTERGLWGRLRWMFAGK